MTRALIVFEGPEGAGKTTQLRQLGAWLSTRGESVITLREPGGTALGDTIRQVLLDPASVMTPRAEALLFMASRAELVEQEIRPALERGAIVLLDRFFLSTYAYQSVGRGIDEAEIRAANAMATGGLVPNLTVLLRIPAAEGLARASKRGGPDRMERVEGDFHSRVEQAFDLFATPAWQHEHPECGAIMSVDASGSEADVHARVVEAVSNAFPTVHRR